MAVDVDKLRGPQRDAFEALWHMFSSYGLTTLAHKIYGYIVEGFAPETIAMLLQETPEWKTRFAGNEQRKKEGLGVLSPAEYLSVEASYAQVARQFGLPKGFYDDPSDYANLIGKNVSPTEYQARLELRRQIVTEGEMTGVATYARTKLGMGTGDLIALFTDPDRALPLLEQQTRAAHIGAAAATTGFGDLAATDALRLSGLGVTPDAARTGFEQAAELEELTQKLPGQRDDSIKRSDLVAALLEQNADSTERVRSAQDRRRAPFQGGGSFRANEEGFVGLGSANS